MTVEQMDPVSAVEQKEPVLKTWWTLRRKLRKKNRREQEQHDLSVVSSSELTPPGLYVSWTHRLGAATLLPRLPPWYCRVQFI